MSKRLDILNKLVVLEESKKQLEDLLHDMGSQYTSEVIIHVYPQTTLYSRRFEDSEVKTTFLLFKQYIQKELEEAEKQVAKLFAELEEVK